MPPNSCEELSHTDLLAQGWQRRSTHDATRLEESAKHYRLLGFEVFLKDTTEEPFGPDCGACKAAACNSSRVLYTRFRGTRHD